MKVKAFLRKVSIKNKMIGISLLANIIILFVNIVLMFGINNLSDRMDMVYKDNLFLEELMDSISHVQNNMTEYLNTKNSDVLTEYYRSEQELRDLLVQLDDDISSLPFSRMERNIKRMCREYIDEVNLTIEYKRGRNVEKYRIRYENATRLYDYIESAIYSLNNEQFAENSGNYTKLLSAFRRFETISNLVLVLVIIGNIIVVTRLTLAVIRPLQNLTEKAGEVGRGNFEIPPLEVVNDDEVGVVTEAFNQMTVSIRDYIDKLRESSAAERRLRENELLMQAHLKEAQLKYLQAQINPHFLFNTLNAGAQLAMMEGADKTNGYIQHVANFFRYNVKKGSDIVTIREEIELIDNYIYILNVRFSGDIRYNKKLDESVLDTPMPSMILQPIVENCVNHGIREMLGDGCISLEVFRIDDIVCVSISDNGKGLSQDMIADILNGSLKHDPKSSGGGIALDNVIARLRLFTGESDPISITSEGEGKGTRFDIYLDV
ncbi:MAG: histidine kinase [Lachnospiraceae bacterium]|nr:histidine kinase [Lachnospiraceae bacterium]